MKISKANKEIKTMMDSIYEGSHPANSNDALYFAVGWFSTKVKYNNKETYTVEEVYKMLLYLSEVRK